MKIERRYTKAGESPYANIPFRTTKSEIRNPDGSIVFSLDNIDVPNQWSQVAADVLAQKYFRKAGVPARLKRVEENDRPVLPVALRRRYGSAQRACPRIRALWLSELSAKQVFDRLSGCLDLLGLEGRLFRRSEEDAQHLQRRAALHARQTDGRRRIRRNGSTPACTGPTASMAPSQGHYLRRLRFTGKMVTKSKSSYEHPQPHACFIQGDQ